MVLLLLALVMLPETHTGSLATEHFTVRYRPGSRAGAAAERTGEMAERELALICRTLGIPIAGAFELYLYDDVAELHAITETKGNAGFSSVNKVHIPFDNDQTRLHEMVHVVAYRLPKSGEEARSMFFAEGLANAVLVYVHGVHVHAVASFSKKRSRLPSLAMMTGGSFYEWMGRSGRSDAYDLAASWFRYLLDTHGARRVVRYYTGTPAAEAFGAPLTKLERGWHAALDAYTLRPEVETLLRRRAGEAAAFDVFALDPFSRLPEDVRGKPGDWKELTGHKLRGKGFTQKGGVVTGRSDTPDWTWCELGSKKYKNCVLRAKVKAQGVGVQLRLGPKFQAMFTNAGAFVWGASYVNGNRAERFAPDREIHLVVVRRDGAMQIFVDGFLVVEGKADATAALPGLGVAQGTATFTEVFVRKLK